ncbi:hypothetical protein HRW18_16095 [Streptomyces lunaelactis]|uniref:hypothetical protein n=1 Tax=Streptomyces lunaelactis TaxID=1535768 RepID=UPI0015849090|nr:hypothetical protein [Streptomyces lunaelactis]NUK09498.1 hypothetical protein [Streptomyces lunaelactis]NUK73375.1 hypothetical protein [Streptomyces lunaelactis]NUL10918.1 hypothetical protein [Streptomyces lunaelactis]NUL24510.1 hypothetical protein [Streptomyces lunaelactis]
MTQNGPEVDPKDAAAIAAYNEELLNFTTELNRLHIAFGAPSYATLVKASANPRLTKAGINEVLSGKRLPSLEALLEFVRVVSNQLSPPDDSPTYRARPELITPWRSQWQDVKLLQRQAQDPWKRLRTTLQNTLDQTRNEAEAIRTKAREEAERIIEQAREVERIAAEVLAKASAEAEGIRTAAQAEAAQVRAEAERCAAELLAQAKSEAEALISAAKQQAEEQSASKGTGWSVGFTSK